jgi:hypothetical protein
MNRLWSVLSVVLILTLASSGMAFAQPEPPVLNVYESLVALNEQQPRYTLFLAGLNCDYFDGKLVSVLTREKPITLFLLDDFVYGAAGGGIGLFLWGVNLEGVDATTICARFAGDHGTLKRILTSQMAWGDLRPEILENLATVQMLDGVTRRVDRDGLFGWIDVDLNGISPDAIAATNGTVYRTYCYWWCF